MARSDAQMQRSVLSAAADDAETALKLFLQGKFDEAEAFVVENAKSREAVVGAVPIFTHCHAVILFAKAGITATEEDRKQAVERLNEVAVMAREHVPTQGWVKSIASWGISYFATAAKPDDISEEELSCRIIEAEATFLSALLCFFEESMSSFFKAALLIRKAIGGYKHCHAIIQRQQRADRSKHDVGAVQLGFGGFSVAISMLPPKLLRLLSVLGFPCNRQAGLKSIDQSLQGGGLRSSVAGVLLLSYHVILPSFFSIPQEREEHVQSAERVISLLEDLFPGSFFLSFYRGRLQRLKGDLTGSIEWFLKLDKGLQLQPESKFFKVRHAWVYELGLSHMMQLEWEAAERYWSELQEDSVWSPAFFAYVHAACLCMRGETKAAADNFSKVTGLMRGMLSGRILSEEQYVSRKIKEHSLDSEEGARSVQGRLSGVEFLYLWNSFPQMPQSKLEEVVSIISKAEETIRGSDQDAGKEGNESNSKTTPAHTSSDELQIAYNNDYLIVTFDLTRSHTLQSSGSKTTDESWRLNTTIQAFLEDEEEEEGDDDLAVCLLMKGTALRELGKLDEAEECLSQLREESCYLETELFVIPMAAYERALLLINKHSQRALEDPSLKSNFDLLLVAEKELALAEGYKYDYNFLWRLLGRVHAAKGAIQALMGRETSETSGLSTTDDIAEAGCHWIDNDDIDINSPTARQKLKEKIESQETDVFFDAL
ncbi:hypothetical protein R1sor_004430 [Riccia sorocarpa]|uniref:Tetratricopeptide repeat (TPR)-like superfamily protein n=1 Tax=Riccia sorocarpa TaxID=122646 RepID=A0ABD3HK63_9MARC